MSERSPIAALAEMSIGNLRRAYMALPLILSFAGAVNAEVVSVVDEQGRALSSVMVTQALALPPAGDSSDGGYPAPGRPLKVAPVITQFSDVKRSNSVTALISPKS